MENNTVLNYKAKEKRVFGTAPSWIAALLESSGLSDEIKMNIHDGKSLQQRHFWQRYDVGTCLSNNHGLHATFHRTSIVLSQHK